MEIPLHCHKNTNDRNENSGALIFTGLSNYIRKNVYATLCNYSANIYLFKVNNMSTGKRCGVCSKLTIKTPDILNFEHTSYFF